MYEFWSGIAPILVLAVAGAGFVWLDDRLTSWRAARTLIDQTTVEQMEAEIAEPLTEVIARCERKVLAEEAARWCVRGKPLMINPTTYLTDATITLVPARNDPFIPSASASGSTGVWAGVITTNEARIELAFSTPPASIEITAMGDRHRTFIETERRTLLMRQADRQDYERRLRDHRLLVWEECKVLADIAQCRLLTDHEQAHYDLLAATLDELDRRLHAWLDARDSHWHR